MQLPINKQSIPCATSELLALGKSQQHVASFASYLRDASGRKDRKRIQHILNLKKN